MEELPDNSIDLIFTDPPSETAKEIGANRQTISYWEQKSFNISSIANIGNTANVKDNRVKIPSSEHKEIYQRWPAPACV